MSRTPRAAPPLDGPELERLALRYVERFATTRAKLAAYLARKLRERGWAGEGTADPAAIAERIAARGYVDDRAFAEARVRSMTRRGLGAARVRLELSQNGIDAADRGALEEGIAEAAVASALAFARRKRFGPFAAAPADSDLRQKHIAAFLRAGHARAIAIRILRMEPGEDVAALLEAGQP